MADVETGDAATLLVFAEDWGRHASGCQHLVRHLLDRHSVCWINTIGTRRPSLDRATVQRSLVKLRHWGGFNENPATLPPRLQIINPAMWPWIRTALDQRLNEELLVRQLRPLVRKLSPPIVGLTKIPIPADLIGRLPVDRWVYYCVDDFSQWPGLEHEPLRQMEERLVQRSDVLLAVSEVLRDRLTRMGREARLLTHGVDLDHWQKSSISFTPLPHLQNLARPLVVFWGLIDRRMDVDWLGRLAADLTEGTVVLVGPAANPDPRIETLPRVVHLPALPYDLLPALAASASVLIMPYADQPVTRAMQPLKLKEYLASGKPAVVRDLPATREWADCLDLVQNAEEFSQMVRSRLLDGLPAKQKSARTRLTKESWEEKVRLFQHWALDLG